MMSSMLQMPKQEKMANSLMAEILFRRSDPRPMEVVITANEVGNPIRRKH